MSNEKAIWHTTRTRNYRRVTGEEHFTLVFRYYGGSYIEVSFLKGPAFEVINVWSEQLDRSTVRSRERFLQTVTAWMKETTAAKMRKHWAETQ